MFTVFPNVTKIHMLACSKCSLIGFSSLIKGTSIQYIKIKGAGVWIRKLCGSTWFEQIKSHYQASDYKINIVYYHTYYVEITPIV